MAQIDLVGDVERLVWQAVDPYVAWASPWLPWVEQYQWPLMAAGSVAVGGTIVLAGELKRRFRVHGGDELARWATVREIRRAGVFNETGMLLGIYDHGRRWGPFRYEYLRAPFEQNVLVVSPPGEMKSAGNAIPTLLWCDTASIFCLDMSGDLVAKTAAHRRTIGPVYILDLNALTSDAINPLDYPAIRWGIDGGVHEGEDCQRASGQLVAPESPRGGKGPEFYERMAKWVLPMAMMYVKHGLGVTPSPRRLFAFFASDEPIAKTLHQMREVGRAQGLFILEAGANLLLKETSTEQRGDWKSAAEWLLPYADDVLAAHTDETNIPWWDFQQGARPMTIYLVAKADDVSGRLGATVRLAVEQFIFHWTDRHPDAYRHEGILLFDDFGRLGYVRPVDVLVSEKRKYGLRFMGILQSFKQLETERGSYRGLLNSCGCWVSARQSDPDDAELIERKVGDAVVEEPVERVTTGYRGLSRSRGVQRREHPLMPRERIMRLSKETGDAVVCVEHLTIRAKRINAYTDRHFQRRMTGSGGGR